MGNIVLTFNEALSSNAPLPDALFVYLNNSQTRNAVKNVAVSGNTLTLTLNAPMSYGDTGRVQYIDSDGINSMFAIQDINGNDTANFGPVTVTNNLTNVDTIPPVFQSAATNTNGTQIVLTYHETLSATPAGTNAFSVVVNNSPVSISNVSIAGKTVVLTLSTPVQTGQTVMFGYTDPSANDDNNAVQDMAGNDAVTLAAGTTVTNNSTVDTIAPYLVNTIFDNANSRIELQFNESLDSAAANSVASKISLSVIYAPEYSETRAITSTTVSGNSLLISSAWINDFSINTGVDFTLDYQDPTVGNDTSAVLQDAAGNDAVSFKITYGMSGFVSSYTGTSGKDYIMGGSGNDTIIGGQGNDTMWGYQNFNLAAANSTANNDLFKWNAGDAGAAGAVDTIKDFTVYNNGTGDKLDLLNLLSGWTGAAGQVLTNWITSIQVNQSVNGVSGSTAITIDVDGAGSGTVTQVIQLEGTNLLANIAAGQTFDQQLAALKNAGVLVV